MMVTRKDWDKLSQDWKRVQVQKVIGKPGHCHYCDVTRIELFSRSGLWPADEFYDYVWVCRKHARLLQPYQKKIEPKPVELNYAKLPMEMKLPRHLFPWLYHNSMSGTFLGASILDKCCAFGRFR